MLYTLWVLKQLKCVNIPLLANATVWQVMHSLSPHTHTALCLLKPCLHSQMASTTQNEMADNTCDGMTWGGSDALSDCLSCQYMQ